MGSSGNWFCTEIQPGKGRVALFLAGLPGEAVPSLWAHRHSLPCSCWGHSSRVPSATVPMLGWAQLLTLQTCRRGSSSGRDAAALWRSALTPGDLVPSPHPSGDGHACFYPFGVPGKLQQLWEQQQRLGRNPMPELCPRSTGPGSGAITAGWGCGHSW